LIITTTPRHWTAALARPLERRHGLAPRELLAHLERVNGHAAHAPPVDDGFVADVVQALHELPHIVRARLRDNFLGVYFVSGAGSSAVTDIVVGPEGEFHGIAIALEVSAVAGRGANEWATWRENMPFQPGAYRVAVRIAGDGQDNRKNAIQFLLLHEIGHVLSAGRGFVPDWWLLPQQTGGNADYSFLPLSWRIDGGVASPRSGGALPLRERLAYYGAPRLSADHIMPMYRALLASGFFTMYSTLSPDEDFAESFALYVHTELLNKPYFVRLYHGQRLLLQYAAQWNEERFNGKLRLLRHFLPDIAAAARQPFAPLIGVAPLMRMAFTRQDMVPIATALVERADANPLDAHAYLDCSTVLQLTGDREVAMPVQAEAVRLQAGYTLPPKDGVTGLRLLVIMGLGDLMANTPIEFLLEDSDVAIELLYLTDVAPWPPALPEHDLMMVAVAESDANQPLLRRLADWLANWNGPVLNRPERIAVLSRDGACAALAGIDGVEMPVTARVDRARLAALAEAPATLKAILPDAAFPLIVRPLGSHAGHDLEKIDAPADLAAYLERVAAARFYLARFVDYHGALGMYRKYRIVLIAGRPFVCHYAFSEHWMIHYLNAHMDQSAAKRAEEAECMAHFDQTFAVRHRQALAEIDRRIGLPYVGIDCAETPDGRLLVFEIDNAMIVHAMDDQQLYPYKKPAMEKVFAAFRQLLEARRRQ
jgi:glutathione synthase/RimK-type ligase-like ATP-grasp enzyme